MNESVTKIIEDKRPIRAVYHLSNDEGWSVGRLGITKIVAYQELDLSTWVAFYKGDFLFARMSTIGCEVIYQEEALK